jgi:hypothetical protein
LPRVSLIASGLWLLSALTLITSYASPASSQAKTAVGSFKMYPVVKNVPMPARVLKFPANQAVGGIAVLDQPYYSVDEVGGELSDRSD